MSEVGRGDVRKSILGCWCKRVGGSLDRILMDHSGEQELITFQDGSAQPCSWLESGHSGLDKEGWM